MLSLKLFFPYCKQNKRSKMINPRGGPRGSEGKFCFHCKANKSHYGFQCKFMLAEPSIYSPAFLAMDFQGFNSLFPLYTEDKFCFHCKVNKSHYGFQCKFMLAEPLTYRDEFLAMNLKRFNSLCSSITKPGSILASITNNHQLHDSTSQQCDEHKCFVTPSSNTAWVDSACSLGLMIPESKSGLVDNLTNNGGQCVETANGCIICSKNTGTFKVSDEVHIDAHVFT